MQNTNTVSFLWRLRHFRRKAIISYTVSVGRIVSNGKVKLSLQNFTMTKLINKFLYLKLYFSARKLFYTIIRKIADYSTVFYRLFAISVSCYQKFAEQHSSGLTFVRRISRKVSFTTCTYDVPYHFIEGLVRSGVLVECEKVVSILSFEYIQLLAVEIL